MLQHDLNTTTESIDFDRPSQNGLGAKTAGGAAIENPEAVEAIADRVRDEILCHVDAVDVLGSP
jgi:hypothetical protein